MWEKSELFMVSHAQEYDFNMPPCTACGEIPIHHTVSGVEKRCNHKEQLPSIAFLWHPVKRRHHIKREKAYSG
jgi:hypothetical protein